MSPQRTDHLSPDELKTLQNKDIPPAAELPLAIIPATGLSPPEYLHLHRDWITFGGDSDSDLDSPIIRIPEEEQCRRQRQKPGNTSRLDGFVERGKPCVACRNRSKASKFIRNRPEEMSTVVVVDDEAADLVEWWFSKVDTIPWHRRQTALKRVCREYIGREITLLSLRHTFAARAATMGIDKSTILSQLGVQSPSYRLKEIISNYDKGKLRGYTTFNQYLEFLELNGPATPDEIADYFDFAPGTVNRKMSQLQEFGLVIIKRESKTGYDGHQRLWDNNAVPPTTIQCPEDGCPEEFYSLFKLKRHFDDGL